MTVRPMLVGAALLVGCAGDNSSVFADPHTPSDPVLGVAYDAITADDLLRHVQVLSADSLEGRAPTTIGEEKTVRYLESQFRAMGLSGGMPDGSFVQYVTMRAYTPHPEASFHIGSRQLPLAFPNDYVVVSRQGQPTVDVDAEMVFVGYGVEAPEYGWDDFKNVDLSGKVVLMLINDPAIPDPRDSTKLDSTMFRGNAMTYYGRWTYKIETAAARGAAAALIIHETGPAGYPFSVAINGWSRESFDIDTPEQRAARVIVEGWLRQGPAEELLSAAGLNFAALKAAARQKDFKPVPLGARARIRVRSESYPVQSRNVVAMLPGSDSLLRKEYLIYTAHWDHLGRDTSATGDQIFNGARDNASGVSQLLSIAKGFTALPNRPKRSVIFAALTGEEKGMLGARYFAAQPPVPLSDVLAGINLVRFNTWGRTKDLMVIGHGSTTLEDVLNDALAASGRGIVPDPEPEKGFFYRSSHVELARRGVPVLYTHHGLQFVDRDSAFGRQKRDEYTSRDFHQPSDEVRPDWDLAGAVADTRVMLDVGYRILMGSSWPTWKPGSEFKAQRDASLRARGSR
ncbi:MAG TPA: peptidase M28 [Gemmatimonas aurantiaca]|nr:peptidase M28 [Gemmatimonas aurantiaca]